MTREFDKQRRDDSRPSFRRQNPNNYGEERNTRPPRSRLSREAVDRAWEQGAQFNHADYRPRSGNGSTPRTYTRRNNQNTDLPPAQNRSQSNRPYGPRREDNAYHSRQYGQGQPHPRSNSYGPEGRSSDQPRSQYRGENRYQGNDYQRDSGNRYNSYRGRDNQGYQRDSRPPARPGYRDEYFEGDYERFSGDGKPREENHRTAGPYHRSPHTTYEPEQEERHVTRLPDGRVLKGSRPSQRRQAQFWSNINDETSQLVQEIRTPPEQDFDSQPESKPASKTASPAPQGKPQTPHKKQAKETKTRSKKGNERPHGNGPRPSQRGFKWPTS